MNNFKNESNKAKDIMHDASKKLDSANNQFQGKMNQVKGDIKMDIGKLNNLKLSVSVEFKFIR
jgi:hypothetical protein